ncbi:MAG: hypothetical protein Q9160_007958 [Pyrenula sp. 1 TL-2023]
MFLGGEKPHSVPWGPSGKQGLLAGFKSAVSCLQDLPNALSRSQHLLKSSGKGFMISTVVDGASVALPIELLQWYTRQPINKLSLTKAHGGRLHLDYTAPGAVLDDIDMEKQVIKVLTRHSKDLLPEAHQELEVVSRNAPYDRVEWKSMCVFPEMVRLATSAASRMLVGVPLCKFSGHPPRIKLTLVFQPGRNQEYTRLASTYTTWSLPSALFIKLFPRMLRPVVGSIVRYGIMRFLQRRLLNMLRPLMKQRLQQKLQGNQQDEHSETFPTWWIDESAKLADKSKVLDPHVMAQLIIQMNLAGIHTTSLVATIVVFELLQYPQAADLINELRAEIASVTSDMPNQNWNWAALARLKLLDSLIRETMRMNPVDESALLRVVVKDIETPHGLVLKAGTKTWIPAFLANRDPAHYERADTFDPYRFYHNQEPATTTSEHFLTFGSGGQACAGRWFAIGVIKMILARMLTRYDLQLIDPKRPPKGFYLGTLKIPDTSYKIKMRLRQESVQGMGEMR